MRERERLGERYSCTLSAGGAPGPYVRVMLTASLRFVHLSILSWRLSTLSIFPYSNRFIHDTAYSFMSTATTEALPSHPVVSHENLLFDYPEADVILHSRDSYEFRVLKIYIVHSSQILGEKVLISPTPQPKPASSTIIAESDSDVGSEHVANASQVPVVQLPIDGVIIFSLLTYIFPVPPVLPSAVEQVMELLSVAQMYKMDVVLTHIRNHIAQQEPPFIRKETAFVIYSSSLNHSLRPEALQAAGCTLSFASLTIEDMAKENVLDMMPGAFLHELWKYHQRVRSNLSSDLEEFETSNALTILGDSSCESTDSDDDIPSWLESYISTIGTGRVPAFLDITDFHMALAEHGRTVIPDLFRECASCSNIPRESIRELWGALTAVVRGSISKVRVTYVAASPKGPEHLHRPSQISHFLLREHGSMVLLVKTLFRQSIQICLMRTSSSNHPTLSISVSINRRWLRHRPFSVTCSPSPNLQTAQHPKSFPWYMYPRMR